MRRHLATSDLERELGATHGIVVGMDEVGRGALSGPVAVGACMIRGDEGDAPPGLADSKLLSPKRRSTLAPLIKQWAPSFSVGWASNVEIDRWGIVWGLRLAGMRALAALDSSFGEVGLVLLDGSFDWLSVPEDLFSEIHRPPVPQVRIPKVMTKVKADAECTVVAAASVLAKVARDEYMSALDDPGYGWASNKGYASRAHIAGLERLGASPLHRISWHLPGCETTPSARLSMGSPTLRMLPTSEKGIIGG